MTYFLAKTDPDTYSIGDFERDQQTTWDGVTNAQAVRAHSRNETGRSGFHLPQRRRIGHFGYGKGCVGASHGSEKPEIGHRGPGLRGAPGPAHQLDGNQTIREV
jgi:EVE domain